MARISIDITEDFDIYVSVKNDKLSPSKKKIIDIDTLYGILESSKGQGEEVEIEDKRQRREVIYSSKLMSSIGGVHILQHIILSKEEEIVVLQREARPTSVAFFDTILDNVGMPSMLFAVRLYNNRIQNAMVLAVKDRVVKPESLLYRCPVTNVGPQGNVCFGSNNLSQYVINNFYELNSFPGMFFMMPASHELSEPHTGYKMHLRPLLNHLKDKEFDNEMLIEAGFTYEDWINKYVLKNKFKKLGGN